VCYRSSMLPLCSLARERLALIVAHSCNSLALIVALACNSPVHTHRALIVPHRRSSYQASCVHPRSSWRTSCVRRCSSMLMLENALRVCYAQVRSLYAPLLENALRSSSLLLATALSSLIVPHRRSCLYEASSAHVHAHARERLAFISSHYRRTCLQQPFTHRSSRWLSLASVLRSPRSSSRTSCVRCAIIALLVVAHVLHVENALRGLRSIICNMLPCSRTPCVHRRSFNPATALRSSSLLLATDLIGPHRRSSYQASCVHPLFIHAKAGELLAHA